jgi:hypothetical protein
MTIDFIKQRAFPRTYKSIHRFERGGRRFESVRKLKLFTALSLRSVAGFFSYAMGVIMNRANLTALKFFALLFLLPGLGGRVFSAMVSTDYLESLPKSPAPSEQRMTPRNVHGTVVYQTAQEDERLSAMEYASVSVFLVGLLLGIVYLEKWSSARQFEMESDLLEEAEA